MQQSGLRLDIWKNFLESKTWKWGVYGVSLKDRQITIMAFNICQ